MYYIRKRCPADAYYARIEVRIMAGAGKNILMELHFYKEFNNIVYDVLIENKIGKNTDNSITRNAQIYIYIIFEKSILALRVIAL